MSAANLISSLIIASISIEVLLCTLLFAGVFTVATLAGVLFVAVGGAAAESGEGAGFDLLLAASLGSAESPTVASIARFD